MRKPQINEETLFAADGIVGISASDVGELKGRARQNRRKSIRLCAHQNVGDALHEMFIAHSKDTYIRPHKHQTKSVSFHVIEGLADVVLFDDEGNIIRVVPMGDYPSGRQFFCRISDPCYYTQLVRSEFLVFHETIRGPYEQTDTAWASWAPDQNDAEAGFEYLRRLMRTVENFHAPVLGPK